MRFLKRLWRAVTLLLVLPILLTETFIKGAINTWKCSDILYRLRNELRIWKKIFKLNVLDDE